MAEKRFKIIMNYNLNRLFMWGGFGCWIWNLDAIMWMCTVYMQLASVAVQSSVDQYYSIQLGITGTNSIPVPEMTDLSDIKI